VATWALASVARTRPLPDYEDFFLAVKPLTEVLKSDFADTETLVEAVWALVYICNDGDFRLSLLHAEHIIPRLVVFLHTKTSPLLLGTMRLLSLLSSGVDEYASNIIDYGALPKFFEILTDPKSKGSIRKEVYLILSNITSCRPSLIEHIVSNEEYVRILFQSLQTEGGSVLTDCIWIFSNALRRGNVYQVAKLVDYGVLRTLKELLDYKEEKILIMVIECFNSVLKAGTAAESAKNPYAEMLDAMGIFKIMEDLQHHPSEDVYSLLVKIFHDYCDVNTQNS
jgi:hypothetical protein